MAIAPNGTKQKTYYVRENAARIIAMIASQRGDKESEVVSEALEMYINNTLTEEEIRVFGYKKEKQNGNGSAEHVGQATQRASGKGAVGKPPGSKKPDRPRIEARHRNAER